mgnify:CR=1 FL=1
MALSERRAKLLRRLHSTKQRAREGLVLVEGIRAVSDALHAGASTSFAVVSPRLGSTEEGRSLMGRLGHDILEVSDAELASVADTEHPQGVLLVAEEPTAELGDAVAPGRRVLVLDAVQDPGNVGTLVRSAVAFAFDGVVALDGTTDPWGAKAVRASAGVIFHLPVVRAKGDPLLAACRAAKLPILAASAEGSAGVDPPAHGFALVIGNEGAGVRSDVRAAAEAVVAVAMAGPAESLNAGIAGAILMSEFTRTKPRGDG